MRIRELGIDGFGIFAEHSIEGLGPGLNLFLGENEAGKSTLLAFVRALLFGFPDGRSKENPYPPLRGGAHGGRVVVERDDGELCTVERHPGPRGGLVTVTAADGSVGAAERLRELLGTTSRELFRSVYAFSLSELQSLETLQADGVRTALYGAAAGTSVLALPRVQAELDRQMADLYKPGGTNPLLNLKLSRYGQLEAALREATGKVDRYNEVSARIEELGREMAEAHERDRQHQKQLRDCQTLLRLWPRWLELLDLEKQLAALPPAPTPFPENGVGRFEVLAERRAERRLQRAAAERKVRELDDMLGAIELEPRLLAHAAAIRQLRDGAEAQAERDDRRARLARQRDEAERGLQRLTDELGSEPTAARLHADDGGPTVAVAAIAWSLLALASIAIALPYAVARGLVPDPRPLPLELHALPLLGAPFGIVGLLLLVVHGVQRRRTRRAGRERALRAIEEQVLAAKASRRDRAVELGDRIADLDEEIAALAQLQGAYTRLAAPVFTDLSRPLPPPAQLASAVRGLTGECEAALASAARRDDIEAQLRAARSVLAAADQSVTATEADIEQLVRVSGGLDEEDFRHRGRIEAERAELRRSIADLERALVEIGDVRDLAALRQRLSALQRDDIAMQARDLEESIAADEQAIGALHHDSARLEIERGTLASSDDVARLRSEQERERAEMIDLSRRWAQAAIARRLLEEAKKRFQRERQPRVLADASRYLDLITGGQYCEVRATLDEQGPLEVLLAADGSARDPERLSRGTQEQLYLALRCGYIVNHQVHGESLPIVMDEVLVNFDPRRGQLAARAIVELSERRQVLFFTCHPFVRDFFANCAPDAPVLRIENGRVWRELPAPVVSRAVKIPRA